MSSSNSNYTHKQRKIRNRPKDKAAMRLRKKLRKRLNKALQKEASNEIPKG